jgi:uncharacterized protein (TIGR02147 family)
MIVNGKRQPGRNMTAALKRYFDFSPDEARHFDKLLALQRKQGSTMRLAIAPQNADLPHESPQFKSEEEIQNLLLNSLTHIIREMTTLRDFVPQPVWIMEHLNQKVSEDFLRDHIEGMKQNGLITADSDGRWLAAPVRHKMKKPERSKIQNFHTEVLDRTLDTLSSTTVEEKNRAFVVNYLNVKESDIPIARELIAKFQSEFNSLIGSHPGDAVYQLSLQFVPVASKPCSPVL